jgi:hypothetical protein
MGITMLAIVSVALNRPSTFVVLAILIAIFGTLAAITTPTDIFLAIRIPASAWSGPITVCHQRI